MARVCLGILAHVDAGKTSLTERLLFTAGVIDELGSVDSGSTQTDSLALERQRGITIRSTVVSFPVGGLTVDLIDTPGHPDFIAEVERVLGVLDGAVLVLSAVEGVQAQTRVLFRTLRRLGVPTLLFVNKIDRAGADLDRVVDEVRRTLSPSVVSMGSLRDAGTSRAAFVPSGFDGTPDEPFRSQVVEVLAEHDDRLLATWVADEQAVTSDQLWAGLVAQTRRGLVFPVFAGSATSGAGVEALTTGIERLLPPSAGDPAGRFSGRVFKVERGPGRDKIAYVRVDSGTLRARERVRLHRPVAATGGAERLPTPGTAKVTGIAVFDHGRTVPATTVPAGQIAELRGLHGVQVGDTLTHGADTDANDRDSGRNRDSGHARAATTRRFFAPPSLETVVAPARAGDKPALHAALTELAEQDPLINLRQDDLRGEIYLSLYGEVQKEVIQATLAADYGLDVTFHGTTTVCVERPCGTGSAVEHIATPPNPFLATVGLRIDPAPADTGIRYRLEVEPGSMPFAFMKAVEETVYDTMRQGLYGWQVTDCVVTLTHSGYWARQSHSHGVFDKSMSSTAGDFRHLTPLVLMDALTRAGTVVCEPIHRFGLDIPADTLTAVLGVLTRLRAVPHTSSVHDGSCRLEGDIPASTVHALHRQLAGLTRGEGTLESTFDRYRPVQGDYPTRRRTDHNPLDRKEYLLRVQRRTAH